MIISVFWRLATLFRKVRISKFQSMETSDRTLGAPELTSTLEKFIEVCLKFRSSDRERVPIQLQGNNELL